MYNLTMYYVLIRRLNNIGQRSITQITTSPDLSLFSEKACKITTKKWNVQIFFAFFIVSLPL